MNNHFLNYTLEGKNRVGLTIGGAYNPDFREAKRILTDVLQKRLMCND